MSASRFHTGPRQVYILPTRFGLLYAGALFLMLLVSVNYNNGLGHLFTFTLAAIGVVSMHYTQRNLVGIRLSIAPGKPVFAGESALFSISVQEQKNRPRSTLWLRGGDCETSFDLSVGECTYLPVNKVQPSRGLHSLPEIYLVSLYPMGLFCAWSRRYQCAQKQLVYPRPAPPIPLPEGEIGSNDNTEANQRRGDDEFDGLREHQHGDPRSHIHWKHSARGTGLKTKLFSAEGATEINLGWSQAVGKDDNAKLGCLCRWVLDAESSNLKYALELPGIRISADIGPQHQKRCLEALALWEKQ